MFEELAERFCFKRNGADDEVGLQPKDLRNGFEFPAIAELREVFDGSDVRAPARHTDQSGTRAETAKNRCSIGRERDDSQLLAFQGAH